MTAVIGYGNLIDTATLGGTVTNAANLQDRYLAHKASAGAGSYLDIDLGSTKSIGVVAVVAHTQASGTIRVQGGSSAGSGSAYDSTALAIYSGSDYAITFTPVSARYWRITFSAASTFGRVFIGPRFKPATNMDWNPSFARESRSVIGEALSGMEFGDKRSSRRVWRGAFSWLTPDEADEFGTIQEDSDIVDEVYWIEEESDVTYRGKRWFLGRFRQLSPIEYPYLNTHTVGVEIGELL